MIASISVILPSLLVASVDAVANGLARTPQMGWNNWNSLGCDVSEKLLIETSKNLVDYGLRDVGYNYVVLDDCWQDPKGRGKDGKVLVDKKKFPSGMKAVAKKIHDQGLLYGMYSSAGEMTCARYEGSLDHEEIDAEAFASWDVDYLKYDNCFHKGRFGYPEISFNRYKAMADAITKTGRSILYSLCNWGEDYVHTWGYSIANSFRISGDIYDDFIRPDELCSCTDGKDPLCAAPGAKCSVMNILNKVAPWVDRGHPGAWLDLDMLEVGHGGMTDDEYVAHFSMWAAVKSPLLIGADIRHINGKALSILNNPAVIAVNQDPIGRSATLIRRDRAVTKDQYGEGETQLWSGPLYPSDQLVVFLNAAPEPVTMTTNLAEIFVHSGPGGSAAQAKEDWDIYDLWADRMDDSTANSILSSSATASFAKLKAAHWYNSTELSYKQGLKQGDARLLGTKIGKAEPGKGIKVELPSHSVKMYRLRPLSGQALRYQTTRDDDYKDEL